MTEVVAALDAPGLAGEAQLLAEDVARRRDLPLRIVHIEAEPAALSTTELAAAIVGELRPDSLVVMETDRASRWSGKYSVAEHVVDRWGGQSLVVGPACVSSGRTGPIVVPVNGSAGAERAIGPAAELAAAFEVEVVLIRVASGDAVGPARDYLAALTSSSGHRTHLIEATDHVAALVAAADELASRFIVISSRGDRTVTRPTMSRTTSGLAAEAPCPVLIVGEPPEIA
ncbi:MAG: universal stress protein [Acidimicrobiia bacterium]|nr:universal stress protein [Acidimicrobiia bacterium]